MNASIASKAYGKVGVESGALGADPHKLISMLYQGALLSIANAKNALLRKDIAAKGAAITKAVAIVDEGLSASLDKKVGGELAENLASLYAYMSVRLTQANLNNDMGALDEVARLLNDLKGAWESIRPGAATGAPAAEAVPAPAAKAAPVYEMPIGAKPPQAKAAPAPAKTAPVAAVPQPAKIAPAAPAAAAQPKFAAAQPNSVAVAAATAPAQAADAPPSLPPQQQRMASKVQSLYGRV